MSRECERCSWNERSKAIVGEVRWYDVRLVDRFGNEPSRSKMLTLCVRHRDLLIAKGLEVTAH